MHRFKIAGEFFDEQGEAVGIVGGSFRTLSMAKRAVAWLRDYIEKPSPEKIPSELVEVAAVVEPETLEIALYVKMPEGGEEWIMSFDPDSGQPVEVSPNAEVVWRLVKKALKG